MERQVILSLIRILKQGLSLKESQINQVLLKHPEQIGLFALSGGNKFFSLSLELSHHITRHSRNLPR
jgi:hypothetical protein